MHQQHGYSASGTMHPSVFPMGQEHFYGNQYFPGPCPPFPNPTSKDSFGDGPLVVPTNPMSTTGLVNPSMSKPQPLSNEPPSYFSHNFAPQVDQRSKMSLL